MLPVAVLVLLTGMALAWIAILDRDIAGGLFHVVSLLTAVDFGWRPVVAQGAAGD